MIRTKGIIFLFIILWGNYSIIAQNNSSGLNFTDPKQKRSILEFKLVNNNIIVPVSINSSDTLWFMLDSGLRTTLITELTEKDSIQLKYAQKVQLHGLGEGEPLEALTSYLNTIRLGKMSSDKERLNILMTDIFNLSRKAGTQIHGILGFTAFRNTVVEIDYLYNKVTFYNPQNYKYPRWRSRASLPLEIINKKPYFNTWITLNNGNRIKVKLLIDTGSSLSLWLQENKNVGISVPKKTVENLLGQGLNGDINGKIGRIQSIEFGKYIVNQPIAAFPDTTSINRELITDHRNGSIGGDLLRRFKVIIDYPNKRITFFKNKHFKRPFTYNNSGIEIEAPFPGVRYYIIAHIMKNSPGEEAGVMVGDQLRKINNIPVEKLKFGDVHKILISTKRKILRLEINRNGENKVITIKTRKLI
jgi:hypothetical protein